MLHVVVVAKNVCSVREKKRVERWEKRWEKKGWEKGCGGWGGVALAACDVLAGSHAAAVATTL